MCEPYTPNPHPGERCIYVGKGAHIHTWPRRVAERDLCFGQTGKAEAIGGGLWVFYPDGKHFLKARRVRRDDLSFPKTDWRKHYVAPPLKRYDTPLAYNE